MSPKQVIKQPGGIYPTLLSQAIRGVLLGWRREAAEREHARAQAELEKAIGELEERQGKRHRAMPLGVSVG